MPSDRVRRCGRLCVLGILAFVYLVNDAEASPAAPEAEKEAGFVILAGKYLPPPYSVEAKDGVIQINGVVAWAGPGADQTVSTPEPAAEGASPKDASDLVMLAAQFLRKREVSTTSQMTPALRTELAARLRTYAVCKSVEFDDAAITVTDQGGKTARLHLDFSALPTTSEIATAQIEVARKWNLLLNDNGLLLISASSFMVVPPLQTSVFLSRLVDALSRPEEERRAAVATLVNSPSIAADLLAAGSLPDSLRVRIPPPPPSSQPPRPGPGASAGGPRLLLAADEASPARLVEASVRRGELGEAALTFGQPPAASGVPLSHIPKSTFAIFLLTLNDTAEIVAPVEASRQENYIVSVFESGWGFGPGDVTIDRFLATSGDVAILYFDAHGDRNSICLEQYRFESSRDRAYQAYIARGIPVEKGVVYGSFGSLTYNYTIDLNRATVATWKGSQTIVETSTCDGFGLADAFLRSGAREVLGPGVCIKASDAERFNNSFWPRMAGTLANGTQRNVIDAFRATIGTSYFHKGNGHTVLSPAVTGVVPSPGADVEVGITVTATITFDTPMDTKYFPVWDVAGSCDPKFLWGPYTSPGSIGWRDDHTFYFSFIPRKPGDVDVDVAGGIGIARSGENENSLDGNQIPTGTDHVAPNGDMFKYLLHCVRRPTGTVPTPGP